MKKFFLLLTAAAIVFAEGESIEKSGFLTTQACADSGAFTDCHMENYVCGSDECYLATEVGVDHNTPLVLFSHDDGVVYKLDISALPRSRFDMSVNRNAVTVTGEYDADTETITVRGLKSPPPPKKSFFKGCL
ncbi:MAG: hypothetical protein B5M52_01280 [Helicobacteraceae bacterium 4484_230]|nr:MAG: hypothetical protein B5M52_01280 [Helicobacteraceae bacterium 4484_230]